MLRRINSRNWRRRCEGAYRLTGWKEGDTASDPCTHSVGGCHLTSTSPPHCGGDFFRGVLLTQYYGSRPTADGRRTRCLGTVAQLAGTLVFAPTSCFQRPRKTAQPVLRQLALPTLRKAPRAVDFNILPGQSQPFRKTARFIVPSPTEIFSVLRHAEPLEILV
jgi:hypothetical protein